MSIPLAPGATLKYTVPDAFAKQLYVKYIVGI